MLLHVLHVYLMILIFEKGNNLTVCFAFLMNQNQQYYPIRHPAQREMSKL